MIKQYIIHFLDFEDQKIGCEMGRVKVMEWGEVENKSCLTSN
jgi:hypothetical protein